MINPISKVENLIAVSKLLTRCDSVDVKYNFTEIKWNLKFVHRGLKPLIPYLLGFTELEGRDSMVLNLAGSEFILRLNEERYAAQLGVDEINIVENDKHKISRYHRNYSDLNDVLANLLAYEIYSICKSAYLEKIYKDVFANDHVQKNLSPFYKIEIGREYNLNLGPNYCSNLCLPNYRKFVKRVKIKNDLISLNRAISGISLKKITLGRFISNLDKSKIHNFGILHINEFGDIAVGETWYQSEGSYGLATAGGFNPTPYHPRYGIAVESYEEFGLKIADLSKVKIIRSHSHYCTGLVFSNNFTGELKVTTNEFRVNTGKWLSFNQMRSDGMELRNVPFALQDYFKFAEKQIFSAFKKCFGLIANVEILFDVEIVANSDGNTVLKPKQTFAITKVSIQIDKIAGVLEGLTTLQLGHWTINSQIFIKENPYIIEKLLRGKL